MLKNNIIAIVGLGYVGLPLAHAFATKGYRVLGFDINQKRISELQSSFDATKELDSSQLLEIQDKITYTVELDKISEANIYIVTVPTPIDNNNRPDLTPLIKSSQSVGKVLKKGDLVIYESTVYPGVTEEICIPELEKMSNLIFNKDFFCGYSPERINPGDKIHTVTKIKKVTSGSTPDIAKKVNTLYQTIIEAGTFLATSIKVAEASKVIENTQRDVNIALINELALIFDTMGISTNEVIDAAATKWNFIELRPGLVGGHCIGVDPYYLTYKAEELGYKPNLILGARQINNGMGKFIAEKTVKLMIQNQLHIKDSNILICGFTFKENCPDTRNTKVVDIISELMEYGINISVFDPYILNTDEYTDYSFVSDPFLKKNKYDAIIIAVAHNIFQEIKQEEYEALLGDVKVIVDVKKVLEKPTWRL